LRWSRRPFANTTARAGLCGSGMTACAPWFPLGFRSVNEPPVSVRESPWPARFPMLITCTNCGTSYQVAAASLGPTGRSVRCARCKQTWFAANTEALADVAEAHRADLTAIAAAPSVTDSPAPEWHFAPSPDIPPESDPPDQAFDSDAGMTTPAWPDPEPV